MNLLKYRFIPYLFSGLLIVVSVFFMFKDGFNLSNEFEGGATAIFTTTTNSENVRNSLDNYLGQTYKLSVEGSTYTVDIGGESLDKASNFKTHFEGELKDLSVQTLEVVQPTVGRELLVKTGYAVGLSVLTIFLYIGYAFSNYKSSLAAVLAMLHDVVILLGLFSIFSNYFGASIDLLFITAVLTVLAFSMYDTVVLFDKVRELSGKENFDDLYIIDKAIKETLIRALNNSFTTLIMMFSLALFLEGSVFWFVLAMLIGLSLGTYSSPFVAANLLYDLDTVRDKIKSRLNL